MPTLTLSDLAQQIQRLVEPPKGILVLLDAETKEVIDLRVDSMENIIAVLDSVGALEKGAAGPHSESPLPGPPTDQPTTDYFQEAT